MWEPRSQNAFNLQCLAAILVGLGSSIHDQKRRAEKVKKSFLIEYKKKVAAFFPNANERRTISAKSLWEKVFEDGDFHRNAHKNDG